MSPNFRVRRVTDPQDPALAAFGRVQQDSYYAPEMLIPPEYFPRLVEGWGSREDRLLVAETQSGEVLGGTIYSLLSQAGFNSFMGVAGAARGQGVGRALQQASLDEVRASGLPGMFADSVHATRQNRAEQQGEVRVGTDPVTRRQTLGALGFCTVDVPYWQPVGGENGGPLANLDLLYCPLTPARTVPLALVTVTMQDYWQDWLGPERAAAEARALAERAGTPEQVHLLPATETPGYWSR